MRSPASLVTVLVLAAACGSSTGGAGSPNDADAGGAPGGGDTGRADASAAGIDASSTQDAAADAAAQDPSYVGQHGALQVVGNEIQDQQGQPIQLRGMSLFWSQWSAPFWNAALVHTLATDWHATVVRAAVPVESGGYLEHPEDEVARVTTVVDAAIAEGIYVVIDWHDHHANDHVQQAQTFFGAMASKYAGVPNVLFEVWNEPEGAIAWSTVKAYAETTLATIRAHSAGVVIVGSPDWSSNPHVAAADPVVGDNVAYTMHFYAASHGQTYRDDMVAALDAGVAVFATEWGTCESSGTGNVDLASTQAWLDLMEERHVSWANWSLFDKDETCAALVPGASVTGPWPEAALTASGAFVKSKIARPTSP